MNTDRHGWRPIRVDPWFEIAKIRSFVNCEHPLAISIETRFLLVPTRRVGMWKLRAAEKAGRNSLLPANPGRQDAGVPSFFSSPRTAWGWGNSAPRRRQVGTASCRQIRAGRMPAFPASSRPHAPRGDGEAPRRGEGRSEQPLAGKSGPAGCRRSQLRSCYPIVQAHPGSAPGQETEPTGF